MEMAGWSIYALKRSDKPVPLQLVVLLLSNFCCKYFQMADWSMEPGAVWMPCDLQLANWTMDPAVCAPGFPAEYASTEVFGSSYQTSVPICGGGKQFVYELDECQKPPIREFRDVADECQDDLEKTREKMHRYPASIRALCLNEQYTTPTVVAIGPYYHGRNHHLMKAEKMKHVAAYQCISDSGYSVQQMYDAVVPVAHAVRSLYDKDVVAGIHNDDFLPMMFYDACFLVQYMLITSSYESTLMEESLLSFFNTNDNEIFHDIMLLENQLPWPVVETIMKFRSVPLEKFINCMKGCLHDLKSREEEFVDMDHSYKPPHLLGLLRFYIVGSKPRLESKPRLDTLSDSDNQISSSLRADELEEIGFKIKANKNTELIHMGVEMKGLLGPMSGKLFLAPLSLDDGRASCLVSMAALELCIVPNFQEAEYKDSVVCSYLLLLAMLVNSEEDVQKLRTLHILSGGGLSNKEVLDLFTRFRGLRFGSYYVHTMIQIQRYRSERQTRIKLFAFWYKNKANIVKVCSIITGLQVS